MKKYLIVFENGRLRKQYKRYKYIGGWSFTSDGCWKFSKQGALKIIEQLKEEYINNHNAKFYLEEVNA